LGASGQRALRELPDEALGYGSARGIHELRHQLAAYLARTRGIVADAESIVVCEGLMAAVGLLREALVLRRIAVPRIGYPVLAGALRRPGPATAWLDVDERGVRLERLPRGPECAAVVQPAHHYPLGVTMPEERAETLLAWAHRRGGLILENDANAETFHDGPGPVALQAAAPERTILMGSVSRTLAPAYAWAGSSPAGARAPARRHRARTDPGPPVIDQMAFARLSRRRGRSIASCGACAARAAAARKR